MPTVTGFATPAPTVMPTATWTPAGQMAPSPTITATPSPTATATLSPTLTVTSTPAFEERGYLPLVARNWRMAASAFEVERTPTPAAADEPRFTCLDECRASAAAGLYLQRIQVDRPVQDWRAFIDGILVGILPYETALEARLEVPAGSRIRVEALYRGRWYVACESVVACPIP